MELLVDPGFWLALFSLTAAAQEVVKDKAYQLRVQPGWAPSTQELIELNAHEFMMF